MLDVLQVMSVVLVAVAMAPALAHLLELPGKLRLSRETYLAVQPIYYPGFTISAGIGETAGPISTAVLLFLSPAGSAAFWLRLVALLGLIGMQAVYWIVTHPVNKYWLRARLQEEAETGPGFASRFFLSDPVRRSQRPVEAVPEDWTALRDRWEYSHVARAVLALVSLVALVTSVTG
ncbi:MAG TPA: anthrone oxygenase family protein [Chloroflexota bacterium]|nr:anthrone oxygenase family protein [Chloroflexota bacterium]